MHSFKIIREIPLLKFIPHLFMIRQLDCPIAHDCQTSHLKFCNKYEWKYIQKHKDYHSRRTQGWEIIYTPKIHKQYIFKGIHTNSYKPLNTSKLNAYRLVLNSIWKPFNLVKILFEFNFGIVLGRENLNPCFHMLDLFPSFLTCNSIIGMLREHWLYLM